MFISTRIVKVLFLATTEKVSYIVQFREGSLIAPLLLPLFQSLFYSSSCPRLLQHLPPLQFLCLSLPCLQLCALSPKGLLFLANMIGIDFPECLALAASLFIQLRDSVGVIDICPQERVSWVLWRPVNLCTCYACQGLCLFTGVVWSSSIAVELGKWLHWV